MDAFVQEEAASNATKLSQHICLWTNMLGQFRCIRVGLGFRVGCRWFRVAITVIWSSGSLACQEHQPCTSLEPLVIFWSFLVLVAAADSKFLKFTRNS